ncbi:hypothetical protein SAY87_006720 [Trapa incisa]|uniref:GATA-type domain-containing protein n=1 Tax=Trapa incisa TaxID=236973 RepID=A0AAN7K346_9MYRT|nr:hypothetical protein SAY87_006720 [Trapa incisa]
MMAPAYLSSQPSGPFPLLEIKEDHHQQTHQLMNLFLSSPSPQEDLSSHLTSPVHHFQHPREGQFVGDHPQVCLIDKVVADPILIPHGGSISSSDHHSSCEEGRGLSIFLPMDQISDQEINSHQSHGNSSLSLKWVSSKMRITHRVKTSPTNCPAVEWSSSNDPIKRSEDYGYGSRNLSTDNGTVRVCSDCKTTTTPLWRSGPRGPKSLCNACGIRQRKARRAMEAAAATMGIGNAAYTDASSSRINGSNFKWPNKLDKKPRSNKNNDNLSHQFKRSHSVDDNHSSPPPFKYHHGARNKKQSLIGNFATGLTGNSSSSGNGGVLPKNEAEAAALLLMELSRGLLHA